MTKKSRQREMIGTLVQIHEYLGTGVKDGNYRISYPQENIIAIRKALSETLADYGVFAIPKNERS